MVVICLYYLSNVAKTTTVFEFHQVSGAQWSSYALQNMEACFIMKLDAIAAEVAEVDVLK